MPVNVMIIAYNSIITICPSFYISSCCPHSITMCLPLHLFFFVHSGGFSWEHVPALSQITPCVHLSGGRALGTRLSLLESCNDILYIHRIELFFFSV